MKVIEDEDDWMGFRLSVICADGFSVSIQASSVHYSVPRAKAKAYKACELGFPNEADDLIKEYAEGEDYTNTVYPYVPAKVIQALLEKHGGIVSGECPQLDLTESEEE
mgnify:CR=1 FL=1|tara:strand:- start:39 stop:362 length:324 start_codon:yes stop_codon:yes gene_type:complete